MKFCLIITLNFILNIENTEIMDFNFLVPFDDSSRMSTQFRFGYIKATEKGSTF
jgi:hypothetical protein